MSNGLTREGITRTLGPVDEATAAEIAATGASEAELNEAYAWLVNDEALVNQFRPFPSERVTRLIEVLRALDTDEEG
jgi:hypothetical protein